MKKCDIKGCKKRAEVFMKSLSFCKEHWMEILGAELGIKVVENK